MSSRRRRNVAAALVLAVISSLFVVGPASGGSLARSQNRTAFVEAPVVKGAGVRSALVHVRADADLDSGLAAARNAGLAIGTRYDVIKVFVAYGTPAQFQAVAGNDAIEALEANRKLKLLTNSSHKATRGQNVLDGAITMPDGSTIDGSGVGVAVIDSGVDGTHPDLADHMGGNVKILCTTPQPVATSLTGGFTQCLGPKTAVPIADTDHPSLGGHGTHVAGTVAGDGTASDGLYHGAAPGATLYGVSVGTTISVENGLDGLAWVLANHDQVAPAIRVVNNSWGSNHADYDPVNAPFHKATWKLQDELIADGVTLVWAAGNASGNGNGSTIGGECVNPTPGLICVANYFDGDNGTRSGTIDGTSSRGDADDPVDWPDVSAPGTNIIATCRLTLPICNAHFGPDFEFPNHYAQLSGTSMASPHVAGIVAQVLQANPGLTPAQIEDLLEDTAHKFTWGAPYEADPYNPDDTTSFEKGHGLVDVVAAISTAMGVPAPEPSGEPEPEPTVDANAPAAPASYYLHSSLGNNNVDRLGDIAGLSAATFDSIEPTLEDDATAVDTPARSGNGTAIYDVSWGGRIGGKIHDLTLDLWTQTPRNAAQASSYTAAIWVGTNEYQTPAFTIPAGGQPAHFTQTFTTMTVADGGDADTARDVVPMAIPTGGEEIWFQIFATANDAGATVLYDSVAHPSGFSINSGPAPTPTGTPTPTPTTTAPPPPSDGRGVYPVTPNDEYFGPGRNFDPAGAIKLDTQWGPQKIQANQAWQEQQATGFNVDVAVLDSGVDLDHPDLTCDGKLKVVPDSDTVVDDDTPQDENGHGTHVAGIIGACTNNETGIAGVAPDATIMPIRVLNAAGSGNDAQLIAGLDRATTAGADVINMSLSYRPGKQIINNVAAIDAAIERAAAAGVVLVAAAGNDGAPLCNYPALVEDIVCVGSTDRRDNKAWYSNFAQRGTAGPSMVAPGGLGSPFCDVDSEEILSTYDTAVDAANDDCDGRAGYTSINGTSMASPHVAGVAALLYDRLGGERSPENAAAVKEALTSTAVDLGAPGADPVYGSGRLNALAAVRSIEPVDPTPQAAATDVSFTAASATAAQHSDQALIEAKLTSDGQPVPGADLVFELTSTSGTRSWTVPTDVAGLASRSVTITDEPGAYQLSVRYAGVADAYLPSADIASFVVDKEDTVTSVTIGGKANKRTLTSVTSDQDAGGLGGLVIEYVVDGTAIGTATTDGSGSATINLPARYMYGPHDYEAVFGGNAFFLGSTGTQQT